MAGHGPLPSVCLRPSRGVRTSSAPCPALGGPCCGAFWSQGDLAARAGCGREPACTMGAWGQGAVPTKGVLTAQGRAEPRSVPLAGVGKGSRVFLGGPGKRRALKRAQTSLVFLLRGQGGEHRFPENPRKSPEPQQQLRPAFSWGHAVPGGTRHPFVLPDDASHPSPPSLCCWEITFCFQEPTSLAGKPRAVLLQPGNLLLLSLATNPTAPPPAGKPASAFGVLLHYQSCPSSPPHANSQRCWENAFCWQFRALLGAAAVIQRVLSCGAVRFPAVGRDGCRHTAAYRNAQKWHGGQGPGKAQSGEQDFPKRPGAREGWGCGSKQKGPFLASGVENGQPQG